MADNSLASAARRQAPGVMRPTCVPFEGAALLGARVRADKRDDLAALLHDFSGSGSVYVVPWRAVPDTLPMTKIDQSLHSVILRERAVTPVAVRRAMREVVASGVAGEAAQQAELAQQAAEEEQGGIVLARLLADFLHSAGLAGPTPEPGRSRKAALEAACLEAGIRPDTLLRALEECAALIQPAGLADGVAGVYYGPLRVLHAEMQRFARHVRHQVEVDKKLRETLLPVLGATDNAIKTADAALREIDLLLAQLLQVLAKWDSARTVLAERVNRLTWAVDGWEDVISYHLGLRAGPEKSEAERPAVLATIVREIAGGAVS